jgi:hypothetical protein
MEAAEEIHPFQFVSGMAQTSLSLSVNSKFPKFRKPLGAMHSRRCPTHVLSADGVYIMTL